MVRLPRQLISRLFPNSSTPLEGVEALSAKSQKLMYLRRLIEPCHAGAFYLMPSLVRVLEKLERTIDRHMAAIGGQKVLMPYLAPAKLWRQSGRWDQMGSELFRLRDRTGADYCLSPTHEEMVCTLVASHRDLTYKNLPLLIYQMTTKFRDEAQPRYGLLRGREFIMKDMYTFDVSHDAAMATYQRVLDAYQALFRDLGLHCIHVQAATGNIGGSLSHEFHIPAEKGEDTLFICDSCGSGVNAELVADSTSPGRCSCPGCTGNLAKVKGIEVGHAFVLDSKYSEPFAVQYVSESGKRETCSMACFGLGVTRIIAAGLEQLSTDTHIRWPNGISPYTVCIIPQKEGFECDRTYALAETAYDVLDSTPHLAGEVLLDDRLRLTIGNRVNDAKVAGYPYVMCLGKKALNNPPIAELIDVASGEVTYDSLDSVCETLKARTANRGR